MDEMINFNEFIQIRPLNNHAATERFPVLALSSCRAFQTRVPPKGNGQVAPILKGNSELEIRKGYANSRRGFLRRFR